MKRDKTIQITRSIAMFFILMCHLLQEIDIGKLKHISLFFNVGVYIFLFISAYILKKVTGVINKNIFKIER